MSEFEGSSVRIIRIGLGEVVSNWGTYHGKPALFIEPVLGKPQSPGVHVTEGIEPQICKDFVSDGGTVLVFHDRSGAEVIIEDINSALSSEPIESSKTA